MIPKNTIFLFIILFLFASCKTDPMDVDASEINLDLTFIDVNKEIMHADSTDLISKHREYLQEIKGVYEYLIGYCMQIGSVSDTAFYNSIVKFREDEAIQKIDFNIRDYFTEQKEYRSDLLEFPVNNGFKTLKYHLPNAKMPNHVVYINSLFRSGVFCSEEDIAVGLEYYLGKDNEVVKQLNPQYYFDWMKEGMTEEFLTRDIITGWIETHIVPEVDGNLAEHLIRWGKIVYLVEAAQYDVHDRFSLRYTEEEYNWAKENEFGFWKYLVDENLLFSEDVKIIRNMTGDGPFTPGIPEEGSPDRMGQYLGWRMVHSYMENNDVSIEKMVEAQYNEILQDYETE